MATKVTDQPGWLAPLGERLDEVSNAFLDRKPWSAATLANWRRGLGRGAMQVPEMWRDLVPIVERVPESRPGMRARVEVAAHFILALYAVHQQSRREPMHQDGGPSLGGACRRLLAAHNDEAVRRRFHATVTAETTDELVGHTRRLVTLLRGPRIPLDYVRLAREVSDWPLPDRRARTRRRWGLDFHSAPAKNDQAVQETEGELTP